MNEIFEDDYILAINDPILLYIAALFVFPGIVQFRNYRLTKSVEYLKFSMLFFLFIVDNIIQSLDVAPFILDMASTLIFSLVNFLIIQIASGVANYKLPIKENVWKVGILFTYISSSLIEVLVYNDLLQLAYRDLHIFLLDIMTLFAGAMVIYAFVSTTIVIPGTRTTQTIRIWISMGIFLMIIGTIRVWNNLDKVLELTLNYKLRLPDILNSTVLVNYLTIFIGLLTLILALFYPETMLLSQTQIMKVAKLIKSSETEMLLNYNDIPFVIGNKQSLKKYMEDVADVIRNENE